LRQHEEEFDALNARVVVVTFEAGFLARGYVEDTGLRWPLLVDETREVYEAYGMLHAGFLDIWGPRTWWAYLKELARGRLPQKAGEDVSQRGGDVLIDPEGIVKLHHVGQGPGDRPSANAILHVLARNRKA
jgi:hypothetical protein